MSTTQRDRKEKLAKKLIELYGCEAITDNDMTYTGFASMILVRPKNHNIQWIEVHRYPYCVMMFRDWNEVLYGSSTAYSMNEHIELMTDSRIKRQRLVGEDLFHHLIKFETLDELDVLLTLAGCNEFSEQPAA